MNLFKLFYITFVIGISVNAFGQRPDITGAWVGNRFDLETLDSSGSISFEDTSIDTDSFTIDSSNTTTIGGSLTQLGFDDGFLAAIDSDGLDLIPLSEELDTYSGAIFEQTPSGPNTLKEVALEIGLRTPTSLITNSDIVGTWIALSQTIITFTLDGQTDEGFVGMNQVIEQINFNSDLTFTASNLSTTPGGNSDVIPPGTWTMTPSGLELTVGIESLLITDISQGVDTVVQAISETTTNVGFSNTDRTLQVILKQPTSITTNDLIGTWGFSRIEYETSGDPANFDQTLTNTAAEVGTLELLSGGVARLQSVNSSTDSNGDPITTTWSLNGTLVELIVNNETISFYVSAGLDFAAAMVFDDDNGDQTYQYITACKLPATDSLFPIPAEINLTGPVQLSTGTQIGLQYQLERSTNLSQWSPIGSPIAGTGNIITAQDANAPTDRAFYRWQVVLGN
ncbi:MAG: hypothetical protein AAFY98_09435 [Verrucomicrobiota bacterium]